MLAILIEVGKMYTYEQKLSIMKAVYKTFQSTFKISDQKIFVRFWTNEPDHSDCIEGRSLDRKKILYQCIIKSLKPLDIPDNHLKILLRETSRENYCTLHGIAACDVDLNYNPEF